LHIYHPQPQGHSPRLATHVSPFKFKLGQQTNIHVVDKNEGEPHQHLIRTQTNSLDQSHGTVIDI
jgi:hypothetical protein